MQIVIWCSEYVHEHRPVNLFLLDYDLEAQMGRGRVSFTADPDAAMRFESMTSAMVAIMEQPQSRLLREDGQPNRPLRGLSMLFLTPAEASALIEERRVHHR